MFTFRRWAFIKKIRFKKSGAGEEWMWPYYPSVGGIAEEWRTW